MVGIPTPLKNDGVSSSVGMMTFHSQYIYIYIWKVNPNSSHVPVTTNQSLLFLVIQPEAPAFSQKLSQYAQAALMVHHAGDQITEERKLAQPSFKRLVDAIIQRLDEATISCNHLKARVQLYLMTIVISSPKKTTLNSDLFVYNHES